jgi:hypothetical protein
MGEKKQSTTEAGSALGDMKMQCYFMASGWRNRSHAVSA